jgi:hypothetical protein
MRAALEPDVFSANDLMARIREGMRVVDAAGEDVGKVEYFEMGNPEAATAAGNEPQPSSGLLEAAAESITPGEAEPDVPEPLRTRLVRTGFIKIDGPGLLEADRYVSSERIRDVSAERVHLAVRKSDLPKET